MSITEKECNTDCTGIARVVDSNAPLWTELATVAAELVRQAATAGRSDLVQQGRAIEKQARDALAQQCLPYVVCREVPEQYIKFLEAAR